MTRRNAAWKPIEDKFWAKVAKAEPDDCWLWTASVGSHGYGQLGKGGQFGSKHLAHRLSYELNVGPIPEGMTIDHLCNVKRCVNPAHLRVATYRENVLRSVLAPPAIHARKTHCMWGHPFDEANTRLSPKNGRWRACRACAAWKAREYRRLRREARA